MARNQPPQQQPPPVQRVRIRYAKRGRLRFSSHRDFSRALERALFRAQIPMAYSSGFNPHPRISYAGAAPTGSASEAEYVELALAETCDPAVLAKNLDEALPPGLDVIEAVTSKGGSLADRLEASLWSFGLPTDEIAGLAAAVEQFKAAESMEVERMTKKGLRRIDIRAAVLELVVTPGEMQAVIKQGSPTVRPADVLSALAGLGCDETGGLLATRLWQGTLGQNAEQLDPLGADR